MKVCQRKTLLTCKQSWSLLWRRNQAISCMYNSHMQLIPLPISNSLDLPELLPIWSRTHAKNTFPNAYINIMAKQSISTAVPSNLISYTEPMKYGEPNTRINSLAGPTNHLTHSPTFLNNLEEKFALPTDLPGLETCPCPY
jgi:hypothetical protein